MGNDVLSELCNDIKLIVYRYLFDAVYDAMKREYSNVWLNGDRCWSSERQCFVKTRSPGYGVANWRKVGDYTNTYKNQYLIYTFDGYYNNNGTIPKNYESNNDG